MLSRELLRECPVAGQVATGDAIYARITPQLHAKPTVQWVLLIRSLHDGSAAGQVADVDAPNASFDYEWGCHLTLMCKVNGHWVLSINSSHDELAAGQLAPVDPFDVSTRL